MRILPTHEQRKTFRFPVKGVATVRHADGVCRCSVCNLSLGGALLRGDSGLHQGDRIDVVLRIQGVPILVLEGRVVREHHARGPFAVRFVQPPPDVEDLIADLSVLVLTRERHPSVLVVDRAQVSRRHVSQSLYERGWQVLTAETPLEALTLLQEPSNMVFWVLVAEGLGKTNGYDLLDLVRTEHPSVKRGVFTTMIGWPAAHRALSTGLIDGALVEPISDEELELIGTWPPNPPPAVLASATC